MPRPDHELVYATNIPDVITKPGYRLLVMTIVDVRSDKSSLDAEDYERHTYGAAVKSFAYVEEGNAAYNTLAEALHQLATGNRDDLNLFSQVADPAPTPDLPPATMAPLELDNRPAQEVKLADLEQLELSPGRLYAAAHELKSGAELAEVTTGWTSEQRDYLAGFLSKPKKRTPRKATKASEAPQETTA